MPSAECEKTAEKQRETSGNRPERAGNRRKTDGKHDGIRRETAGGRSRRADRTGRLRVGSLRRGVPHAACRVGAAAARAAAIRHRTTSSLAWHSAYQRGKPASAS